MNQQTHGVTVVSLVSAHGRLSIHCNFGPHGRLPGTLFPYEAATLTPWNESMWDYRSVLGKHPWALKHTLRFWPAWALTRDIISIRLYRSCYIDPLKWEVHVHGMGTYPGVGACWGYYGNWIPELSRAIMSDLLWLQHAQALPPF